MPRFLAGHPGIKIVQPVDVDGNRWREGLAGSSQMPDLIGVHPNIVEVAHQSRVESVLAVDQTRFSVFLHPIFMLRHT